MAMYSTAQTPVPVSKLTQETLRTVPVSDQRRPSYYYRSGTVQVMENSDSLLSRRSDSKGITDFCKLGLRRMSSGRFLRSVESAARYFDTKEEMVIKSEEHDNTEPIEEESKSVDVAEYIEMKKELAEVKKELTVKEKIVAEQKRELMKLEYNFRELKTKVEDPLEIKRQYNNKIAKLEAELKETAIKLNMYVEQWQREKYEKEQCQRSFTYILKQKLLKSRITESPGASSTMHLHELIRKAEQVKKEAIKLPKPVGLVDEKIAAEVNRLRSEIGKKEAENKALQRELAEAKSVKQIAPPQMRRCATEARLRPSTAKSTSTAYTTVDRKNTTKSKITFPTERLKHVRQKSSALLSAKGHHVQ